MEPLTLPQILEVGFGFMSVGVGVAILFLARRIAPVLTLFLHRRLLHVWVLVGLLIVASQFIGALSPLFRSSTFTDIVEELVELAVLSCVVLALYLLGRVEREEISSLRHLAEVDELTGLSSRSFFYRAAARRIELSKANNLVLTCGRVLRESLRADDIAARYGGEGFVLLMSGGLKDVAEVAERVRQRVEVECTSESDASLRDDVTVSLGVASLDDETSTLDRLLEVADVEMYRSKRLGKNQTSVARYPQGT